MKFSRNCHLQFRPLNPVVKIALPYVYLLSLA